MNQEKLSYLSAHSGDIDVHNAQQLEELTRLYPYFAAPWVVLSRHFKKTGDIRFESTLHNAALRVTDRKWLHDFIEGNAQETLAIEPTATESTPETEDLTAIITEVPAEAENISESESIAEAELTFAEVDTTETDLAPIAIGEDEPADSGIPGIVEENEKESETAVVEIEESAAEEILSQAPTEENRETEEPFESEKINIDNYHEATEATITETEDNNIVVESGIIIDIDRDAIVELNTGEAVFEEITEFDAGGKNTIPDPTEVISTGFIVEPILSDFAEPELHSEVEMGEEAPAELEEETEDAPQETAIENKPAETATAAPPVIKVAVYNIEDYFRTEEENAEPPSDFFSWLKKPKWHEEQEEEENSDENPVVEHKLELIDRFLHNNPGISKPKTEFYKPAEAAKKSELMPHELATETLAKVYIRQENWLGAVRIYEKLMLKFPEKSSYFADLIQKLKKEHHL